MGEREEQVELVELVPWDTGRPALARVHIPWELKAGSTWPYLKAHECLNNAEKAIDRIQYHS